MSYGRRDVQLDRLLQEQHVDERSVCTRRRITEDIVPPAGW
jgi:hypothetical protein